MALNNVDKTIRPDIIEAATQVFGRHGYERATLDEIAGVVGMQKGSLYYHIESKEQLLMAIHTKLFHLLTSRLNAAVETAGSDAILELEQVIGAIVEVISANRDAVRVVLRDRGSLSADNSQAVEKNRTAVLQTLEKAVRRVLRATGAPASAGSVQVIAYGIMGMTYFVSEWVNPRQHSVDVVARMFSALAIDGLARAPAKALGTAKTNRATVARTT